MNLLKYCSFPLTCKCPASPDVVEGDGIGNIEEREPLPLFYEFHGLYPADGGVYEHDTILVVEDKHVLRSVTN